MNAPEKPFASPLFKNQSISVILIGEYNNSGQSGAIPQTVFRLTGLRPDAARVLKGAVRIASVSQG